MLSFADQWVISPTAARSSSLNPSTNACKSAWARVSAVSNFGFTSLVVPVVACIFVVSMVERPLSEMLVFDQLPVAFGDDFDSPVNHFYCGLIVDQVRRCRHVSCPSFSVGDAVVRQIGVIKVWELSTYAISISSPLYPT